MGLTHNVSPSVPRGLVAGTIGPPQRIRIANSIYRCPIDVVTARLAKTAIHARSIPEKNDVCHTRKNMKCSLTQQFYGVVQCARNPFSIARSIITERGSHSSTRHVYARGQNSTHAYIAVSMILVIDMCLSDCAPRFEYHRLELLTYASQTLGKGWPFAPSFLHWSLRKPCLPRSANAPLMQCCHLPTLFAPSGWRWCTPAYCAWGDISNKNGGSYQWGKHFEAWRNSFPLRCFSTFTAGHLYLHYGWLLPSSHLIFNAKCSSSKSITT